MKVTDLNNDVLFEADLMKLHKEYETAKKELKHDVDVKIVLDKLKQFVMKYVAFDKKYNTKKKRITEIEATAKKVIKYVTDKVEDLKAVAQISAEELEPLEFFLKDMSDRVEDHVSDQEEIYKKTVVDRRRR